jgi:HD-GYP domain-containing protein (c-di-GMP phosphodiesterase class II)
VPASIAAAAIAPRVPYPLLATVDRRFVVMRCYTHVLFRERDRTYVRVAAEDKMLLITVSAPPDTDKESSRTQPRAPPARQCAGGRMTTDKDASRQKDVLLSGGYGRSINSARAGFLPICLERAPIGAFQNIPVYLRTIKSGRPETVPVDAATEIKEAFTLYSTEHVSFTETHRQRLVGHGVKFVYIPMGMQTRFREQTESSLQNVAEDPTIAVSVKSEIIYETSVELVNELLSDSDFAGKSPRLEKVSRAVTTLVLNDPTSFSHLFAASHHDFYTATHMVNVATWMVPVAYAMGIQDVNELNHICQAGILHDIGKVYIAPEILNKKGKLTDEEWRTIRSHPEMGCKYLEKFEHIHPLVYTVTKQHHERIDGSGYPDGLKGDAIHMVSRICAVVDSFDAMTAFRPFKDRTMSVAEAMHIIVREAPTKYDTSVVDAWTGLLQSAEHNGVIAPTAPAAHDGKNKRKYPRFPINCPARAHTLEMGGRRWEERPGIQVIAHNISRSGLGFLTQTPIRAGEHVRVYLQGKGSLNRMSEGVTVRCREYKDGWYEVGMQYVALNAESADTTVLPAA